MPLKKVNYEAAAQRRPVQDEWKDLVFSLKRQSTWGRREAFHTENVHEKARLDIFQAGFFVHIRDVCPTALLRAVSFKQPDGIRIVETTSHLKGSGPIIPLYKRISLVVQ